MAKKKGSKITIGVVIAIVPIGLLIFFISASYPDLDVQMYFTEKNLISSENVEVTIEREDSRWKSKTDICFQINNLAESVSPSPIDASNFQTGINTNANCETCNIGSGIDTLPAQESKKICKKVTAPINTDKIFFEVVYQFEALNIPLQNNFKFICKLVNEDETKNSYLCHLE